MYFITDMIDYINLSIIILVFLTFSLWVNDYKNDKEEKSESFDNYGNDDIPPIPLSREVANCNIPTANKNLMTQYNYEDTYSNQAYENNRYPIDVMALSPGRSRLPLPVNLPTDKYIFLK